MRGRHCTLPMSMNNSEEIIKEFAHTHTHCTVQYLLDCVRDVRFYLSVLREDEAGQQGGALLRCQRTQRVLKQQLCEQELMTADLTRHSTLQLHCSVTVDVLQSLQDLCVITPKNIRITQSLYNATLCYCIYWKYTTSIQPAF